MDAAFSSIAFAEPATAEANLSLLEQRLPAALWAALPAMLGQLPDPDGSLNYLERYGRDLAPRIAASLEKNPTALHYLLLVFSYSHFLSETLLQQPELILWLHRRAPGEGLDRVKSREDLLEELARYNATLFDSPPSVVLARFKRREYLRIMLRDVLGLATVAETTLELSLLADVLIERALRTCEQKLENTYGAPQAADSSGRIRRVGMTVISLGKLGGQELNYASDIDLMFLYGQAGQTAGGSAGSVSNGEYFVRLAQMVLRLITEATPEGAVFRVDLRLRPEGQQGDLAVNVQAALDYYRHRAREWELQMLIRARVSAGDTDTGQYFLRAMQPMIYRREFNLAAAAAVLNARHEITRELKRAAGGKSEYAAAWNVKLTPGGIRDIEFLSQCLQRLYGGAETWLTMRGAGSTLVALQRLHDKGFLSGRDFFRLGSAYQFLRVVEHRLQLRNGLQRHTLPDSAGGLERLARRCGVEPAGGRTAGEQLVHRISQHFAEVREIYDRILLSQFREGPAAELSEFAEQPDLEAGPLMKRLRNEYPAVGRALADALAGGDAHGRRGLQQYLASALLHPETMNALEGHPEWLARAGEFFARSDLAVETLCRNPDEIEILTDSAAAAAELHAAAPRNFEEAMAALRVAHRKKLLAILARALLGGAQQFETFAEITKIADEALTGALDLAYADFICTLPRGDAARDIPLEGEPFAVIALGRLGTGELDLGSDADLIFVRDETVPAAQAEGWRRLAERFVHVVSSHTREGLLLPVDTRLRPRGTEGEIVQSAAYLREYFQTEAEGWEAATFLKARALAGNLELAGRVIADVQTILADKSRRDPQSLAQQLARTRERLEREGAEVSGKGGFKKVAGGYYDIEYILAYVTLTSAALPHGPGGPGHVLRQIAGLESSGALDTTLAQALREGALLYRALDHAVRLVTGRAAQHVPEPALAERVASLLEQWGIPVDENLQVAVEVQRREIRAIYEQIVIHAAR